MEEKRGYIVTDTEGTGLFDYKQPADAEGQPRLASLTMIYVSPALEIERIYSKYIRPDGWKMTEGATKVNGLTDEFLNEHGIPVTEALNEYQSAIDNGRIFAAHNAQHDAKQLRAELRRAGMDDRFEHTLQLCTMRAMTDICKIPPKGNRGGYKWPALSECLLFIGETDLGDHTAENDAMGCYKVLRYLHRTGNMPIAKVHYAKNRPGGPQEAA
jgi:DNA polymerase III epsilon subunit-like protein